MFFPPSCLLVGLSLFVWFEELFAMAGGVVGGGVRVCVCSGDDWR